MNDTQNVADHHRDETWEIDDAIEALMTGGHDGGGLVLACERRCGMSTPIALHPAPAWMHEQLRQHAAPAPHHHDPRALVLWCRGLAEAARTDAPGSWIEERMPFSWSNSARAA